MAARRRAAPQPSPLVRTGQLSEDRAADARADFAELVVARYGRAPLAGRAWELRDNLMAYAAVLVALSELLGRSPDHLRCPPGPAPGLTARVELSAGG
jgi:hypothetical protein